MYHGDHHTWWILGIFSIGLSYPYDKKWYILNKTPEYTIFVCPEIAQYIVSLHLRSMWETICDAQAGFWLHYKFLSKFSSLPPNWNFTPVYPPQLKNFRFEMTKVYSGLPPPLKLKNFRFEMTKVYSRLPPQLKNFRFEMAKVYSGLLPPTEKLQIWDGQSLLRFTPPNSPGDRMWRLICNPWWYHSFSMSFVT